MKKTSSHTRKSKDILFRRFYHQGHSDAVTLTSWHVHKHFSVPAVLMPQSCQITEPPMPTSFVLYRAAESGAEDSRRALWFQPLTLTTLR